MDNNITTISIAATADTKKAEVSIDKLAKSLERLKSVTDFSISENSAQSIKRISEALAGLSNVGKVNIGKDLPTRIEAFAKSLDSLSTVNVTRLKEIAGAIKMIKESGSIGLSTGLSGGASGKVSGIAQGADMGVVEHTSATVIDSTNDSLAEQKIEVEKTASAWARMKQKLASVIESMRSLKKVSDGTKEIGDNASRATSKFGQLLSAIKRIAVYRAIRSALKAITQAFREGIANLYQYSALMDGTFKQSMDMLATSALYLKNSLGAMVAPILNALAPAVDILVDKFVDLLNIFNQFLAMITGASTWTKALKYPKEYANNLERAGGAAKELRATLLGFDEINRLDDLKARGGGGGAPGMDYSQMFEEVPLIKKSLTDMWEDFLESGKSKFTLWAAGLAGILSLKLSGGLTGIFGGAAGSASLMGGFTATLLAAFAGFRLGNWLYYNVPGIRNFADDLMDAGLGDSIMTLTEDIKNGWGLMIDGMIAWGDKLWGFFDSIDEGWGILVDDAISWGDKLWDAWDTAKENWNLLWDKDTYTVLEPDMSDFADGIIDAMAEAGLIFDKGKGTYTVDINSQGKVNINNAGGGHYYSPNYDSEVKIEPEPEKTTVKVTVPQQSYIPAYLRAKGGSVNTGDLFFANEQGPELIGHVGNKTQVANNDQITESIRVATAEGNAESNMLLREAVSILGGILAKDNVVVAEVTTDSITNGLSRQNLRNGRMTVPVGG